MKNYYGIVLLLLMLSARYAIGTPGDIRAVRILSDGWRAEVDVEGFRTGGSYNFGLGADNVPLSPTITLTIVSQGYNSNGVLGTITRTVYGTRWVRLPYPNQSLRAEVEANGVFTTTIALSDFVYYDDRAGGVGTSGTQPTVTILRGFYTDSGPGGVGLQNSLAAAMAVTNNSTLTYPKVIGRWAWPGYEKMNSDFLVEAVAFNRFARYGNPVAAVKFNAEDQSGHSSSALSTAMTISSRSGDKNPVLVYAGTLDIDTLSQSETIAVNFKAFPWVGDESSVLDSRSSADGVVQPDERLGPLHYVNDKKGQYGSGYAYVAASGDDTTGQVYVTQTASENGSAFRTIEKAAEAIRAYHSSNFGRSDAGGGTIVLASGSYNFPGAVTADLGAMKIWLTIKPASNATRASTVISTGFGQSFKATHLKIEGLTVASASANLITGRSATDILWLHNNSIDLSAPSAIWSFKLAYATDNELKVYKSPAGYRFVTYNQTTPFALIRGNRADLWNSSNFYAVFGNKNFSGHSFSESDGSLGQLSDNSIFAFNTVYGLIGHNGINLANNSMITHGFALVQNLFESSSTTNEPMMYIAGGGGVGAPTTQIILWHNTLVGARSGFAYSYNSADSTPIIKNNWSHKFNIYREYAVKTDTHQDSNTVGDKTGNWSIVYSVGYYGNYIRQNSFPGDFDGLATIAPRTSNEVLEIGYSDNKSTEVNGTGNGTYTLESGSRAIDIGNFEPSLNLLVPYDLRGQARSGAADAGAYEFQSTGNMTTPHAPSNLSINTAN